MNFDSGILRIFLINQRGITPLALKRAVRRRRCIGIWFIILFSFFSMINSCSARKLPAREISIEREGQVIAVLKAEIAETSEEHEKGLMYRDKLPDGEGMFFIYDRDRVLSFWMKNTYIPLSIAFISYDGRIIDIKDMYPNDETAVSSSRSVRYALEVPQGWFLRVGVREGDIVVAGNEPNK